MKAMMFETPGDTDRLKLVDVERPKPGPEDVLVRIGFCGVNPVDRFVLSGTYPARPMPHIPGSEFGGSVEAVGHKVTGVRRGRQVVVFNRVFDGTCAACQRGEEQMCVSGGIIGVIAQGGYAEYAAVPAKNAIPVPKGRPGEVVGATVGAHTAWHAVLARGRLAKGETIAVFGATGSIGTAAIQLARNAGARVLAVTQRSERAADLKAIGADAVIGGEGPVADRVVAETDGRGADLVLDPLGTNTWRDSFGSVARNGRWVTCGALTGDAVNLSVRSLYNRQVELIGSTGGTRTELRKVLRTIAEGRLRIPVWKRFPLASAREALAGLSDRTRFGKVLLQIG